MSYNKIVNALESKRKCFAENKYFFEFSGLNQKRIRFLKTKTIFNFAFFLFYILCEIC